MTVLLAGATGLVGGKILSGLLEQGRQVLAVGRRSSAIVDPGLTEYLVDFAALPALRAADVAVCALGTTMAAAGSKAAFRAVDHDAVLSFLQAAHQAGTRRAILVSAVGAHPDAGAFYFRVKGEVERDASAIGFARLDILRPGLILGARIDHRPMEAMMQRLAPFLNPLLFGSMAQFGAISADMIAEAIVALCECTQRGRQFHGNHEIRQLVLKRRQTGLMSQ